MEYFSRAKAEVQPFVSGLFRPPDTPLALGLACVLSTLFGLRLVQVVHDIIMPVPLFFIHFSLSVQKWDWVRPYL